MAESPKRARRHRASQPMLTSSRQAATLQRWARIAVSVAAPLLAAAGIAACGEAHAHRATVKEASTSSDAVVAEVNRACTTFQDRIDAVKAPSFSPTTAKETDLPAASRYLARVVPLMENETDRISNTARASGTSEVRAAAHEFVKVLSDEQAELRTARIGSLAGFESAVVSYEDDARTLGSTAVAARLTGCLES